MHYIVSKIGKRISRRVIFIMAEGKHKNVLTGFASLFCQICYAFYVTMIGIFLKNNFAFICLRLVY